MEGGDGVSTYATENFLRIRIRDLEQVNAALVDACEIAVCYLEDNIAIHDYGREDLKVIEEALTLAKGEQQ